MRSRHALDPKVATFMCPECRAEFPILEKLGEHLKGHDRKPKPSPFLPPMEDPLAKAEERENQPTKWRFTVEGPLKGYRASIRGAFDPMYRAFKDRVQVLALEAGFDARNYDPEKYQIFLSVWAFWMKRPRIDWSNTYKGVEDSIWGQDRWIRPGPLNGFSTNNGRPCECAEVVIEAKGIYG